MRERRRDEIISLFYVFDLRQSHYSLIYLLLACVAVMDGYMVANCLYSFYICLMDISIFLFIEVWFRDIKYTSNILNICHYSKRQNIWMSNLKSKQQRFVCQKNRNTYLSVGGECSGIRTLIILSANGSRNRKRYSATRLCTTCAIRTQLLFHPIAWICLVAFFFLLVALLFLSARFLSLYNFSSVSSTILSDFFSALCFAYAAVCSNERRIKFDELEKWHAVSRYFYPSSASAFLCQLTFGDVNFQLDHFPSSPASSRTNLCFIRDFSDSRDINLILLWCRSVSAMV